MDKTTYEKYQSTPAFQPRMEHLVRIAANPSDSQYARIQFTQSYRCPFLSAERLCGVHQEHGESYLPDICASYPRVTQRIDGLRETALLLSCPEAARLVLLNPCLLPDESDTRELPRYQRFARMGEQIARANGSPHQYLWDIRGFTLLLLRDRSYPLWQRVFMLGMFCKRLNEITVERQLGLAPQLLREHAGMIALGKLRAVMDGIPIRTTLQLGAVLEVINHHLAMTDASHVRFRECVQDFLLGIQFDQGAPVENCTSFYEEAHTRYYQPFMEKHPFILENYLINYVFRTRFPYGVDAQGTASDPLTEYLILCVLYAVIKGLLIGMAGHYREEFAAGHVVKAVQSFAKAAEHSPKFLEAANLSALANADGMALLLKT